MNSTIIVLSTAFFLASVLIGALYALWSIRKHRGKPICIATDRDPPVNGFQST